MHVESSRCCRNIAAVLREHFMNVFPLESADRQWARCDRHGSVSFFLGKRAHDFIRIRRFGEIVSCAELDCLDGGRDAGIASVVEGTLAGTADFSPVTTISPIRRSG
jgi:hypothetical protein